MSLQRLHDSAATSGRSDRNDRTIQTHRLHVETAPSAKVRKTDGQARIACKKNTSPPRRSEDVSLWMFTTPYAIVPPMISSSSLVMAC